MFDEFEIILNFEMFKKNLDFFVLKMGAINTSVQP